MSKKNICNFCDKNHDEVDTLIVGDDANICNECIEVCSYVVQNYQKPTTDTEQKRI